MAYLQIMFSDFSQKELDSIIEAGAKAVGLEYSTWTSIVIINQLNGRCVKPFGGGGGGEAFSLLSLPEADFSLFRHNYLLPLTESSRGVSEDPEGIMVNLHCSSLMN
ncbi:unnamed protein product [Thlaspi arvense]|uniref:Uncharacterized protein n=1 Tax=Thlaspi arvense TaxID=13288 RepID=A0AAU9RTB7_THLAR|nr:unnamed protein product [Thlaspi arvense]